MQLLTEAGLEGRGVSTTVLHAYHEQAETATAELKRFVALVKSVGDVPVRIVVDRVRYPGCER